MPTEVFSHTKLLDLIKKLGYQAVSEKGTCGGYATRAIDCFLSDGDFQKFDKNIYAAATLYKTICEESNNLRLMNILKAIESAEHFQDAKINNEPLSDADKKLYNDYLQVRSFLDGVVVFQNPKYKDPTAPINQALFADFVHQNPNDKLSTKVAQSEALEKKGGLSVVESTVGIFTPTDFGLYLFEVRYHCKKNNHDIAFLMAGDNHAVSITYSAARDEWCLTDANLIDIEDASISKPVNRIYKGRACFHLADDACYVVSANTVNTDQLKNQIKGASKYLLGFQCVTSADLKQVVQDSLNNEQVKQRYNTLNQLDSNEIDNISVVNNENLDTKTNIAQIEFLNYRFDRPETTLFLYQQVHKNNPDQFILTLIRANCVQSLSYLHKEAGLDLNMDIVDRKLADFAAEIGNVDVLYLLDKNNVNISTYFRSRLPLLIAKDNNCIQTITFLQSVHQRNKRINMLESLEERVTDSDKIPIQELKNNILKTWQHSYENNDLELFNSSNSRNDFLMDYSRLKDNVTILSHAKPNSVDDQSDSQFNDIPTDMSDDDDCKTKPTSLNDHEFNEIPTTDMSDCDDYKTKAADYNDHEFNIVPVCSDIVILKKLNSTMTATDEPSPPLPPQKTKEIPSQNTTFINVKTEQEKNNTANPDSDTQRKDDPPAPTPRNRA